MIQELTYWSIDPDSFTLSLEAMVEDAYCAFPETMYDPAEYAPALCKASITLVQLEEWPDNDDDRLAFVEDCDPDWTLIDNSF